MMTRRLTKKHRKEIEQYLKQLRTNPDADPRTVTFTRYLKDILTELDRTREELATVRNSLFDQINKYQLLLLATPENHLHMQREALGRLEKALGIRLLDRTTVSYEQLGMRNEN